MIIIETFERGCSPRYRPTASDARDQDRHLMMPIARPRHAEMLLASSPAPQPATACARQTSHSRRIARAHLRRSIQPHSLHRSSATHANLRIVPLACRFSTPRPRAQIPIAPAAPLAHDPSRGFLPWRFSDAGRPCVVAPRHAGRHPKTFTIADSCTAANRPLFDHLVGAQQGRGGMVRPSSAAVLRLITNSNFAARSIGVSAGLAPLRILAAMMPAWQK